LLLPWRVRLRLLLLRLLMTTHEACVEATADWRLNELMLLLLLLLLLPVLTLLPIGGSLVPIQHLHEIHAVISIVIRCGDVAAGLSSAVEPDMRGFFNVGSLVWAPD
jgi:hypothetical protein